ncbi:cytochrome P450 85A1-like, partial [Asparagus officinalis]
ARKKIICMLTEIIEERRASSSLHHDMLDCLLQPEEGSKAKLTNDQIIDVIIALIYSSYETVSTTSMMAVKYLHDHPKILEDLRNEHLEIRKGKLPGDALNSNDYKSMNFTRAVILETLRMASIVKGVLRKTTEDIEIRGFVIPKGWKIILYMGEMNYDPCLYHEPLTFNPRRWM